jgi:hypothetical protein
MKPQAAKATLWLNLHKGTKWAMGFSRTGCWHWGSFFFATPKNLPCSARQFWEPDSDAIPQLFF